MHRRVNNSKTIHGLKYLGSKKLGCKDIEIRKFEFVAKTQFLYSKMDKQIEIYKQIDKQIVLQIGKQIDI